MDQFIFASLSHTHYWYEVGMLKVPGWKVFVESSETIQSALLELKEKGPTV